MNMFINNNWFMPDKVRTGKKIRSIRESCANNTIEKFAASIMVDDKTVYSWESGKSMPSIENMESIILEYPDLDLTFEDLLLPEEDINNVSNYSNELFDNMDNIFNEKVDLSGPYNKDNELYKLSLKRKYYEFFELYIQAYLFSYETPINNLFFLNRSFGIDCLIDFNDFEIFLLNLDKKYGFTYKTRLNINLKNEILFEFYKTIFFNPKHINERNYVINMASNFIDNIHYFNDIECQKAYIDIFPPLVKEFIYNSIIFVNDKKIDGIIKYFESDLDCNRYNLNNLDLKNKDYKAIFSTISKYILSLSYDEYLIERGNNNE